MHVEWDIALSDTFGLPPPLPGLLIQYLIVIFSTVALMRPFVRVLVLTGVSSFLELSHDCLEPLGHLGLADRRRVCENWLGYRV